MGGSDVAINIDLLMYGSAGYSSYLSLYSIIGPFNPSFLSYISNPGNFDSSYLISDNIEPFFISYGSDGFRIINVSNPALPVVKNYDFLKPIDKAYLSFPFLFLYSNQNLYLYDISDIFNISLLSSISINAGSIFYESPYLFLTSSNNLVIYDFSDPKFPYLFADINLKRSCSILNKYENELILGCLISDAQNKTLLMKFDISNLKDPILESMCYTNEYVYHLSRYKSYLFASQGSMGLNIYSDIKEDCIDSLGDINMNGKITSIDSSLVLQYIVGMIDLNEEEKCIADVDRNDKITAMDAYYIFQCINNNYENLPFIFRTPCGNKN